MVTGKPPKSVLTLSGFCASVQPRCGNPDERSRDIRQTLGEEGGDGGRRKFGLERSRPSPDENSRGSRRGGGDETAGRRMGVSRSMIG
jgi:hypothetical protein